MANNYNSAKKKPQMICDLCYGKSEGEDYLIYITENDEYVPYIVIDTHNYGDDAVLLLRQEPFMKEIMYRDENLFGVGGAYYNGSIVDNYLENEFYDRFSDSMKSIIRNTPVKIHSIDYVSKRFQDGPALEIIYRHVFVLSGPECSAYIDSPYKEYDEGAVIPEVHDNAVSKYTWLRSEEIGGDDTHASLCYNGGVIGSHIQSWEEHYTRPVITVKKDEKITLKKINNKNEEMVYVFSSTD